MVMNPTLRLHRYIPGENLLVERKIVTRTRRLDVVPPRTIQSWEPKRLPKHDTRRSRNIVEAGPNAPQLKRLIQYPYSQSTTHPRPGKPWREPLKSGIDLMPAGEAVRTAMVAGERPRWPRATRPEAGPQARPRPSVDDFLQQRGSR